jgi:tubulin--tyrosine ligase
MVDNFTKLVHFNTYVPAIRAHIAYRLFNAGWQMANSSAMAHFSDKNIRLNDNVSKNLEYKHLLGNLVAFFCSHLMPLTYTINDENHQQVFKKILRKHYSKPKNTTPEMVWILKPALLNNGDHIQLFPNIEAVIKHYSTNSRMGGAHVLQQYLTQPDLYQGSKYTFRMPVVITNYAGVFLHKQGYLNICNEAYQPIFTQSYKFSHLTNYIIDGQLSSIKQIPTSQMMGFARVYQTMSEIVRQIVLSLSYIAPSYFMPIHEPAFEIFGFDFILDANQRCWLLEINQGPDFPHVIGHPLNSCLWEPFWQNIMRSFVLPIANHQHLTQSSYLDFTQVANLEDLTPSFKHKIWGKIFCQLHAAQIKAD